MFVKKALQNILKNAVRFQNKQQMNMSQQQVFRKHFENDRVEELFIITKDYVGSLSNVLEVFKSHRINLTYIEPKLLNKKGANQNVMFICTFEGSRKTENVQQAFKDLQSRFDNVKFSDDISVVPWYPRNSNDLEHIGEDLMIVEEDNNGDHPQFMDQEYRKRRDYIAQVSKSHILGQPIPILEYTEQEQQTWRTIYNKLSSFHKDVCTEKYLRNKSQLEKELGIDKTIPQLRDLDDYLRSKTNFRIKAAHGILTQREFLNALAHRVFFSTQYIRHHKIPEYTPEPDIVHEVVGHIPMFADPIVADISQEIGLLSMGANDEQLRRLGNLYWFTIEFGACKENGKMKGYGAGIASSIGECEHFLSKNSRFEYLDPFKDCDREYPIQRVQPVYLYTNSFEDSLERLIKFGDLIKKPMKTWYDFNTQTVECDRRIIATEKLQEAPK
ncbi:hypothetical protein ABPG74_016863 [Tetrahymena malaccensis]